MTLELHPRRTHPAICRDSVWGHHQTGRDWQTLSVQAARELTLLALELTERLEEGPLQLEMMTAAARLIGELEVGLP